MPDLSPTKAIFDPRSSNRVFPKVEREQDFFQHGSFGDDIAFAVLGTEALKGEAFVNSVANDLIRRHLQSRLFVMSYPTETGERTTFFVRDPVDGMQIASALSAADKTSEANGLIGQATAYHIDEPVTGVLLNSVIEAIRRGAFSVEFLPYPAGSRMEDGF
jgi:hypothetical protein